MNCFFRFDSYVIDDIAKEAGKTILILPPYHCVLNPLEMVWSKVKEHVKANNTTFKTVDVQHLINQAIDKVTREDWQDFISHVKAEEEKLWKMDFICDELIDEFQTKSNYILTIGDALDSSSNDDDDDFGCYFKNNFCI